LLELVILRSDFNFKDVDYFPEKDLAKVGEKISQPGDVVFTSKGTVGRFAIVREDTPRFVYSPQLQLLAYRFPHD
jgi:type I restriction enzyme S subunit